MKVGGGVVDVLGWYCGMDHAALIAEQYFQTNQQNRWLKEDGAVNNEQCPSCPVIMYSLTKCPYCEARHCVGCHYSHMEQAHGEQMKQGFYGLKNPTCPTGFHPAINGKCVLCELVA